MSWINRYSAGATALAVTIGIWTAFGFPVPATSADIKRLEAHQLETAIRVYEDQADRLIIRREQWRAEGLPSFNPAVVATDRQLDRVQEDLREARRRRIELGKD